MSSSSGAGLKFSGIDDTEESLARVKSLFDHEIAKALELGGMVIEGEAKRMCPVDTGNLRSSIYTSSDAREGTSRSVSVGTAVHYAPYVEYGTGVFAEGGNGRQTPWGWKGDGVKHGGWHTTSGYPAKPYLRPAFYSKVDEALKVIAEELGEALAKSTGGKK